MNVLKKPLSELIEQLCQELYIEVEYEPPSCYPLEFQSGLDYYQECQKNPPPSVENSSQPISPPRSTRKKPSQALYIRKEDLRRSEGGQYEYVPKKVVYPSLFACVEDLVQNIPLSDLFAVFTWQEFEDFISSALEHYGYNAFRTFRYTFQKKRHEVDVIARDQHTILFIDAKHWAQKTASQGALIKAAELQTQRAKNLVRDPRIAGLLLEHLKIPQTNQFHKYQIYPMVLTTADLASNLIVNGIPIISLAKFNEFLNHLSSIRPNLHAILLNRAIIQKKLI